MDTTLRTGIGQQFGAAIDMLENAIEACPEALWSDRSQPQQFWYVAYHALFWLDLYLTGSSEEEFSPPAPFNRDELDPRGLMPDTPYTKDVLLTYLAYGRRKCQTTMDALTDERAREPFRWPSGRQMPFLELLLYNMRHVQEHASQLSLILGQITGSAPGWVARAKSGSRSA